MIFIKEGLVRGNLMVGVSTPGLMVVSMKDSTKMVRETDMGYTNQSQGMSMKVSIWMIYPMAMVCTSMQMVIFMRGNGKTESCAVRVDIKNKTEVSMKENGKTRKRMVMVFYHTPMGIFIKDIGKIIKNMVKVD